MTLDLRRLEHFVAVADQLNITKAARSLHVSQQALSTSLAEFERRLGVTLFERGGGRLSLTEAGRALRDEAPAVLAAAGHLVETVRTAGRGRPQPVRVLRSPAVSGTRVAALTRPSDADHVQGQGHPPVSVEQHFPSTIWQRLLDGSADLALVRAAPPRPGLSRAVVGYDRIRVAVDRRHRLAGRGTVELSELAEETFVMWAPPGHSVHTDFLVGVCQAAGFEPQVVVTPRQGMPPITAVHDSGHIAFVTDDPGSAEPDAEVLELHPPVHLPLQVIWVTDAVPRHARGLLEQLRNRSDGSNSVQRAQRVV